MAETSVKDKVSAEEWQTRVELAACYRLVDLYGMSDLTGTHISARVSREDYDEDGGGEGDAFLLNPYGTFFDEMTASCLIKVDIDGNVLSTSDSKVNQAGYVIHSAVHAAREDVQCVLHTHTRAGVGVSAQADGLLALSQHSMQFHDRVAYHEYEGVAVNLDERERLVEDLGDRKAMILKNHGLLTAGISIADAFWLMFRLEKSCQIQVDAMAGGADLNVLSSNVAGSTSQFMEDRGTFLPDLAWPGLLRKLDRENPGFRE